MKITEASIDQWIEQIDEPRKDDIITLIDIISTLTHKKPKLWGSIVGFGNLHYRYPSGHEGDMPLVGLANRKQAITLYLSYQIDQYEELQALGKHTHGKGCLYIKKLSDVNLDVLKELIKHAIKDILSYDFITDNEV